MVSHLDTTTSTTTTTTATTQGLKCYECWQNSEDDLGSSTCWDSNSDEQNNQVTCPSDSCITTKIGKNRKYGRYNIFSFFNEYSGYPTIVWLHSNFDEQL